MESKAVVHRVLREYLGTQADADLEEFEVVFDDVYSTLDRRFAEERGREPIGDEEGLPFDAASVSDTLITLTCFVAMALLRATIKAEAKSLSKRLLDRTEEKLVSQIGNSKMVQDIRQRIERILDEL